MTARSCLYAASVSQMLAGSLIVFAAVLSSLFLKRKLNRWHTAGYGCNALRCTASESNAHGGCMHEVPCLAVVRLA